MDFGVYGSMVFPSSPTDVSARTLGRLWVQLSVTATVATSTAWKTTSLRKIRKNPQTVNDQLTKQSVNEGSALTQTLARFDQIWAPEIP